MGPRAAAITGAKQRYQEKAVSANANVGIPDISLRLACGKGKTASPPKRRQFGRARRLGGRFSDASLAVGLAAFGGIVCGGFAAAVREPARAVHKMLVQPINRLLAEYDIEQSALEQEGAELKEGITAQAEDGMKAQRFVSLVWRYTSFDELTTPTLNEFIGKVVVHEADKSTGDRQQKVDIYFNFIGCFVPPKPEVVLTAEEEAKARKRWRRGTGNGSKTSCVCAG